MKIPENPLTLAPKTDAAKDSIGDDFCLADCGMVYVFVGRRLQRALNGMKHTIEYASARAEVWRAYWRAWARPGGLWVFHVVVGLLIATVMEMPSRAHLHMAKFASVWLAASAASTVLLSLWPQIKFKKAVRSMTVDPTGFTTTIGSLSGTRTWQEVRRIEDTGEEILIVGTNGNAMVVPRRAFEDVEARSRFLRDAKAWHAKHAV